MLTYCDIVTDKGYLSNQEIIEDEEGIIFVPLNQSSIKVTIRLNIENTYDNNDI